MKVEVYEEPTGDQYSGILAFAQTIGGTFSLVWQDDLTFGDAAAEVERALEPHLVRVTRTSDWPGTCSRSIATLRYYAVNEESLRVLKQAASVLHWQAPDRPEDLAMYDPEGQCWLQSTAHEGDILLNLAPAQLARLREQVPGLKLYFLDGVRSDGA